MRSYSGTFLRRKKWWVAWCEAVPGALTQGRTLVEAKANLKDAIKLMQAPMKLERIPRLRVVKAIVRV